MDIILASQSPRRRELLERMGIRNFQIVVSEADESISGNPAPSQIVEELSLRKALAVQHQVGTDALIIAADTVVALDDRVLGKPKDNEEAFQMLHALSGRRHQVYSGVTVLWDRYRITEHETTEVHFRSMDQQEILQYIATGEPADKAGAYGIQGYGSLFVEGIVGDYYNVMGLPVCRLGRILSRLGVDCMALAAEEKQEL